MVQPPLDAHYVVMHLGGPKHVTRRRDGPMVATVVEVDSLTLVPAGSSFIWQTRGPIAFAHLYLTQLHLEDVLNCQFDGRGKGASLIERVGYRDALLQSLFRLMLNEIELGQAASTLLLDQLLDCFIGRLILAHAARPIFGSSRPVALAAYRLRRVLDFIESNLRADIQLSDLAKAAGSSQFHFCRAFHAVMGCSPYRYLIVRRIEHAKAVLMTSDESLEQIATRCGFNSRRQFAVMFKQIAGIGPRQFRTMTEPRNRTARKDRSRSN